MVLDLNRLPYFDDYNEDKGFHRILFKPGVAVQARELTQLQTILQNQIERFGNHVFENGARVLGGQFDPYDPIPYVRVNVGNSIERQSLIFKELTGSVTGIKARVIHAEADPQESGATVLFLQYTDLNNQEAVTEFSVENLSYVDNSVNKTIATLPDNTAGFGSMFSIQEGIRYVQGFFVKHDAQKIAIDPFNSSANKKVYFKATFSTVDSNEDISLLDPSQGFNNFNAPGADRLRCELELITSELDEDLGATSDNIFKIIEIRNGQVYKKYERTIYSEVADELAKRTFDESGDYVVRGWNVYTREHLNTGVNNGVYLSEDGGDANKIAVGLEKGLAYVKGYEVNTLTTRYIETDKATDYEFIDEQSSFVQSGPYTEIEEIMGLPAADVGAEVTIYDTAENRVTSGIAYTVNASGTAIGTARVASYIEESGQFGQADATMRLYLTDLVMEANYSFSEARAIGNDDFFADIVLDAANNAVLLDTFGNSKLMYVGSNYVRSVKDELGNTDTTVTFNRQSTGSIATAGTISNPVQLFTNESLPYGTATLGSLAKETLFLTVTEDADVTLSGNVTTQSGNTTVTGSGTSFTNLNVEDRIVINGSTYRIASITNDTTMVVSSAAAGNFTGSYTKKYIAGDIIDLASKGANNGAERTVTTTGTSISINLNESFVSTAACKLTYRVKRDALTEASKLYRSNRLVKFDCSNTDLQTTSENLTKFYLGVSDIKQIRQIRKSSSPFVNLTDGDDVTADFSFNTGVNETSYNTGWIETDTAVANTDYLLVEFDYFEPDFTGGLGYFSIDSYPIDDTQVSNTTILTTNLNEIERNYLDFRPVKTATVTPGTTVAGAPENPTESTTYNVPTNGLRAPIPGTLVTFDYSYYLARRDVLAVDKNGIFKVIRGTPAVTPGFPKVSETYMSIANIFIPPYPSLSGNYAKILGSQEGTVANKITFARHTMRDIGAIKTRVRNLEIYSALNLLEKDTLDLSIPDVNGLDRFKNGVFVDPFVDHSLGATDNEDYYIAVDRKKKHIRAPYTVDGFENNYASGTNIVKTGNLVHLPYTETTLLEQPFATTTRNIELSSYRYAGDLDLNPDIDTWVDTTTVDKTINIGNDLPEAITVETEWGAWQEINSGAVAGIEKEEKYTVIIGSGGFGGQFGQQVQEGSYTFDTVDEVRNFLLETGLVNDVIARIYKDQYQRFLATDNIQDIVNTKINLYEVPVKIRVGEKTIQNELLVEQRTGTETTISVQDVAEDIGTFVTDASLIPYIRPQTIRVYGFGLKPNTRHHVFFDGENMNAYSTPVPIQFGVEANLNNALNEGDSVYSNDRGEILLFLRLPAGDNRRFRVGEKKVTLTDNPTNDPDATSYAENTFVAAGLNLQKQNTLLSTKTTVKETILLSETRETVIQREQEGVNGAEFVLEPSCLAYSFYIDEPKEVEGIFLSSVDVWIESIHPTLGMWFEIREMSTDGNITRNTVPYSTVWMNRSDTRLNTSSDGITNSTNVNFEAPVFLYNKTQYAFVIHTEGLNPDTYFWVSRLGGTDVATLEQVTSRPLTGTTYTTNNNLNWDIVPDVDLKVKFNRASFAASNNSPLSGSAEFIIEDVEFISSNTAFPTTFFYTGEPIRGSEILNIALDGANTIIVGDTIQDSVSNAYATVLKIDGTDIYTDGFDFIEGANVEIYAAGNTSVVRETGSISSVDFGTGVVDTIDAVEKRFDIIYSNGKFFVDANLRSILPNRHKSILNGTDLTVTYTGAGSTVSNPYAPNGTITLPVGLDPDSATVVPTHTIEAFTTYDFSEETIRPSYLKFEGVTSVGFGTETTIGTILQNSVTVTPNINKEYRTVRSILSRSEEVRLLNGEKSYKINVDLSTTSEYLSPILDSSLMGSVFVLNNINDDTTNENLPTGGNLTAKYISRIINLEEGNDAEDIVVLLNEYRPAGTDIKVWARVKSPYDPEIIDLKEWIELSANKVAVSSDVNKSNYIDTSYSVPAEYMVAAPSTDDEIISYVSGDGVRYYGYNQIQIKVGLLGPDRAIYPKAAQLRMIALQV